MARRAPLVVPYWFGHQRGPDAHFCSRCTTRLDRAIDDGERAPQGHSYIPERR